MSRLFAGALRYKAWANRALLDGGERQWASPPDGDARFFVRILNHAHAVDRIFIGHLTGKPHGFDADNPTTTPAIAELRTATSRTEAWRVDYAAGTTAEELSHEIRFVFIGGGLGCMRAGEILLRLLTHGNIHRGIAERVPAVHGLDRPAGTLAHFLHLADAARRNGKPASRSPA